MHIRTFRCVKDFASNLHRREKGHIIMQMFSHKVDLKDWCWTSAYRRPKFMILLNFFDTCAEYCKTENGGHIIKVVNCFCPQNCSSFGFVESNGFWCMLIKVSGKQVSWFSENNSIAVPLFWALVLVTIGFDEKSQWQNKCNSFGYPILPQCIGPAFQWSSGVTIGRCEKDFDDAASSCRRWNLGSWKTVFFSHVIETTFFFVLSYYSNILSALPEQKRSLDGCTLLKRSNLNFMKFE